MQNLNQSFDIHHFQTGQASRILVVILMKLYYIPLYIERKNAINSHLPKKRTFTSISEHMVSNFGFGWIISLPWVLIQSRSMSRPTSSTASQQWFHTGMVPRLTYLYPNRKSFFTETRQVEKPHIEWFEFLFEIIYMKIFDN